MTKHNIIDPKQDRRKNHFEGVLEYVKKDKYKTVKQMVQQYLYKPKYTENSELIFCQELISYIDYDYKTYVAEKCVKYLQKQYGGKVYIRI